MAFTSSYSFAQTPAQIPVQPPLTLVDNGRSAYGILIAPDSPASVRTAAQELQQYIQKSASVKLPILTQNAAPATPYISLGNTAAARAVGLKAENIGLEGFQIKTLGDNVFILGPDTINGQRTALGGTSTGTANGVYTFLEDYFNVRWLLPGEMGEDVPALKAVALLAVDRTEAPFFQNRRIPYIQNEAQSERESVGTWSRRQKLGYSMRIEHRHNWHPVATKELFKTHPEYFAEVGGKRVEPVDNRLKVETTNPEVVQLFAEAAIKAFRANPNLYMYSLSPSDGTPGWSESAATKALMETDPHGQISRTKLVLKFYNDVAKIVGREFPDRKVSGYIYASYLYPPTGGVPPMEPNLFIAIATSISYGYKMYRPAVKQEWDALMKEWSSQTSNISYYDMFNWLRYNGASITPPAPETLNFAFPKLADYKVKGTYIYGTNEWSQGAVNNYVLARMSWNPRLNAHDVCNEFYQRAYGTSAAPHIQQLYELLDAEVKKFYNRNNAANYVANPAYMTEVLGANYPRIEQLYLAAEQASVDATPGQKARLSFFRDNLILMRRRLIKLQAIPNTTASPFYRSEAEIRRMIGRVDERFGVQLGFDVAQGELEDAKALERQQKASGVSPKQGAPAGNVTEQTPGQPNRPINADADE
jgi:hypothetical protein